MKRSFLMLASMCLLSSASVARPITPARPPVLHPATTAPVEHPQTTVQVQRPVTQGGVMHPTTPVSVNRPTTNVVVAHPQTTVAVVHPTTQEGITHPSTTVQVTHPQTTVAVTHPQTPTLEEIQAAQANATTGGKTVAASKAPTSMSNYQPKQAKNFAPATKAAPVGGGSMNLGNSNADQAAKDAAAKASLLGSQNNQNMDVNPKQNKLGGIDKLVTDRAKWKEKQKK